ncbi:MAG: helix-turn-helix domain-containing protein [Ruminococcaceae bacterium]|nr:helix-turn-helix domain-containing protein [Oscillospiraceae bacterium]
MDQIKHTISKNITALRLAKGITQIELAEMLNYSDKAISKWERGESIPDVTVLYRISEIFGVTLDYLVHPHKEVDDSGIKLHDAARKRNHIVITCMSVLLVWLIATIAFALFDMIPMETKALHSLAFIYSIPISAVVWLVFNSIWFNAKRNYLIISLIMWSLLASLYLSFLAFLQSNFWIIFTLGLPGQIIILLWSGIKYPKMTKTFKRKKKTDKIKN